MSKEQRREARRRSLGEPPNTHLGSEGRLITQVSGGWCVFLLLVLLLCALKTGNEAILGEAKGN